MKMTTKIAGHVGGHLAGLDGIASEARADRALLDDGELGGQARRRGAEPPGCSPARTVKLPEIWPAPPVMGDWIVGAEITLLSSTMASGRPRFSVVA